MPDPQAPISEKEYDFRTEPIAQMDESTVDMHLSNIESGNASHPYQNAKDRRHDAATAYALALRERKIVVQPHRDEGAEQIAQAGAERRREAQLLHGQMVSAGFERFSLPQDVQPHHLDIMRRDLLIQQGKFAQVLPDLHKDISRLGLNRDGKLAPFLRIIDTAAETIQDSDPVTGRTQLDLNPTMKQLVTETLFSVHRIIAARLDELDKRRKQIMSEERQRTAAEKGLTTP